MTEEFCKSLSIENYMNMKFQTGSNSVKDAPPEDSKFDGSDGWVDVKLG